MIVDNSLAIKLENAARLNCYQHYTSISLKNKEVFGVGIGKKVIIFIKKFVNYLVK